METARRLRASDRESDYVRVANARSPTARLVADACAILPDATSSIAAPDLVPQRSLHPLAPPFGPADRQVFATVSIGIAVSSADVSPEELLRNADTAMYHAKARGKARYEIFDEGMRERAVARLEIETDLRRALAAC